MGYKAVNTRVVEYRVTDPEHHNITLDELEGFCQQARAHGFPSSSSVGTVMNGNACVGVFVNETTPLVPAEPIPDAATDYDIFPPTISPGARDTLIVFHSWGSTFEFYRRPMETADQEYTYVPTNKRGDWKFVLGVLRDRLGADYDLKSLKMTETHL